MANGGVIMSETLPTVIGMATVSRAVDTTMGRRSRRGRRRTTSRKSAMGKTRIFNGKRYRLANTHTTKRVAEKDAEYFRKAGHSARVVKVGGKWAVYVR